MPGEVSREGAEEFLGGGYTEGMWVGARWGAEVRGPLFQEGGNWPPIVRVSTLGWLEAEGFLEKVFAGEALCFGEAEEEDEGKEGCSVHGGVGGVRVRAEE